MDLRANFSRPVALVDSFTLHYYFLARCIDQDILHYRRHVLKLLLWLSLRPVCVHTPKPMIKHLIDQMNRAEL